MARTPRSVLLAVTVALVATVTAGCGLGPGKSPGATRLLISTNFGTQPLTNNETPETGGSDTVMRLLQRNAKNVETRYGGGFVQSIDGVSGGRKGGRPYDWFYYVNGLQAEKGAASTQLHEGDRIWWDHHDWGSAETPAVVGQFPAPFTQGQGGRRLPTRVECIEPDSQACDAVHQTLVDLGLPAAKGGLATSFVQETLRVVVGPWPMINGDDTVGLLAGGPKDSGVFARPLNGGKQLALLNTRGATVRTLGPGSGLIAATKRPESSPVWIITGTDAAGIEAAASAFDEGALAGHFAIAVENGRPVALPLSR